MSRRPHLTGLGRGSMVLALVFGVSACGSSDVRVTPANPSGRTAAACGGLVADLPQWLDHSARRPVQPAGTPAAAWGDPPIVLRCGVAEPPALKPASPCLEIEGVGWFAERAERGYVFTTIGRTAYVEVMVPSVYAPESDHLVDLAAAIDRHNPVITPCT